MIGDIDLWRSKIAAMRQQELSLRREGLWVSGPSDLLSIGRVADRELTHSALLAWLLTPTGRHGFGSRLLEDILREGWGEPVPDVTTAVVQLEITRDDRRADIVVTAGALTLIIENKVWSLESESQCEDLYRLWARDGEDARFLLLSPGGHPPRQTRTAEAADAWRSMSYASLARWLRTNLTPYPQTTADGSAIQYLESLRQLFPSPSPFAVRMGGGHVDATAPLSEDNHVQLR